MTVEIRANYLREWLFPRGRMSITYKEGILKAMLPRMNEDGDYLLPTEAYMALSVKAWKERDSRQGLGKWMNRAFCAFSKTKRVMQNPWDYSIATSGAVFYHPSDQTVKILNDSELVHAYGYCSPDLQGRLLLGNEVQDSYMAFNSLDGYFASWNTLQGHINRDLRIDEAKAVPFLPHLAGGKKELSDAFIDDYFERAADNKYKSTFRIDMKSPFDQLNTETDKRADGYLLEFVKQDAHFPDSIVTTTLNSHVGMLVDEPEMALLVEIVILAPPGSDAEEEK